MPRGPTPPTPLVSVPSSIPSIRNVCRQLSAVSRPPLAGHGPGIPWADRFSYCQRAVVPTPEQLAQLAGEGAYWQPACVMPLGQIYWVLAVQCVGYMALAIYLDAVLPDPNGVALPPWFFLLPSYWRSSPGVRRSADAHAVAVSRQPFLMNALLSCRCTAPHSIARLQRASLRASAAALAEPSEVASGLTVDPDVAEEELRMRRCCGAYLQHSGWGGGGAQPSPLLPAEEAVAAKKLEPLVGDGSSEEQKADQHEYAVQMFGLRKVYKVRSWPPSQARAAPAGSGSLGQHSRHGP